MDCNFSDISEVTQHAHMIISIENPRVYQNLELERELNIDQ